MHKTILTLALLVGSFGIQAADAGKGPPKGPRPEGGGRQGPPPEGDREGRRPPPPPLLMVLDTDKDGELSAAEIEAATTALKELDKNGDGKLDRSELRPPMPPRDGGEGAEGPPPPPPPHGRGGRRGEGEKSAKRPEANNTDKF